MDIIFGTSWKTTVIGLLVGIALYFPQVGVAFPTTMAEWGSGIVSALIYAWGRLTKDADQTGAAKV